MIESGLLFLTIFALMRLLKTSGRAGADEPDQLLGMFAYKKEKSARQPEEGRSA